MTTYTHNGQEITPESITVESRDGKAYVSTSPLPEYILVHPDFWDEAPEFTPSEPEEGEDPTEPPAEMWVEPIGHADEDVTNDGYVLHIDASNVALAYKLLEELPGGNRLLQLVSWAER